MKRLFQHITLILTMALMVISCSDDTSNGEENIPDGYGKLSFTIGTTDAMTMRSVSTTDTWLEGSEEERAIQSYVILICEGTSIVQKLISNTGASLGSHDATNHYFPTSGTIKSDLMTVGNHTLTIYCLANFTDAMLVDAFGEGGVSAIGTTLPENFESKAIKFNNSTSVPTTGMPMTGKLSATVNITKGQITTKDTSNKDLVLILWRMMAKMEFDFENESSEQVQVLGVEIDPLSTGTAGSFLLQTVDLSATTNWAHGALGMVTPGNIAPWILDLEDLERTVTVPAKGSTNGTGTLSVYVNETDTSYTTLENQLSLRFKVKRGESDVEEIRYGFTSPYVGTDPSKEGFNVICRNDWIKIPIHFTGWQFRIEAIPFVPIAGYPAVLLSSDALNATFSTGGYIILQPFAEKDHDGYWRDFSDTEVEFKSLSWKNSDGTKVSGAGKIVKTPFAYDDASKCITGELNNNLTSGKTYKTTLTVNLELGKAPSKYAYSFSCNVILQK
ncbi:MAG: hypothetical protein IKZ62_00475 [Prevotella sp.]|nr:hypothetical protein [Prevotella sp.]